MAVASPLVRIHTPLPDPPADVPGREAAFDGAVARAVAALADQLTDPDINMRFAAADALFKLKIAEIRHGRSVFLEPVPTRELPADDQTGPAPTLPLDIPEDRSGPAVAGQSAGSSQSGLTPTEPPPQNTFAAACRTACPEASIAGVAGGSLAPSGRPSKGSKLMTRVRLTGCALALIAWATAPLVLRADDPPPTPAKTA